LEPLWNVSFCTVLTLLLSRHVSAEGGRQDVLDELNELAVGGGQEDSLLPLVGVLRAADIFWNLERTPVLCHMRGDVLEGDSPRILVRPHAG
jgi:hypothetical protein